jgi:hypothetical protein
MWTSTAGDRGTTINRVRLHAVAGVDALSAELRASRAIALVADTVTLPAGAILCVRRLRDPRPHRVSLAAGQAPPAEWARAVAETLADLAHRAARPARGPAGADAEAVIFDDRAQMLACLAADWCRGSIAAWWWWRALIGTSRDAEAVVRAWRQYPTHIAAAIEEAARLGVAAAFVRRLPERATAMLLDAVVAAHGLRRQLTSSEPAAPRPPGPVYDGASITAPRMHEAPSIASGAAVWRRSAPEACAMPLRVDQQLLLGVALTVRRDPARTRDPVFVAEVAHWRRQMEAPSEISVREVRAVATATDVAPARSAAAAGSVAGGPGESRQADVVAPELPTNATIAIDGPPDDGMDRPPSTPLADVSSDVSVRVDEEVQEVRERRRPSHGARGAQATIDTGLGGIFYLLNVALALGLYGDFTAPRGPSLDLSIWRFIALVGAALLGGRHRRDPVWRLLGDLAGPAPRSVGGAEWRLDPSWLAAFPERRIWRWSADAARVRVRHPAGFLVLDVRRVGGRSPADQVTDEIDLYRQACAFDLVRGPHSRLRTETEPARWTRWHAAYTRARLARALGVPRSRVGAVLCRHRARVRLSLTHVEVTFPLVDLPIAIRLGGLDRDPGWIPAADRIVSFRYD